MRKRLYSLFIFILAIFAIFAPSSATTVEAKDTSRSDGIPYETLTLGTNNRLVNTQTAYIPYGILNSDVQLAKPSDLYIYDVDPSKDSEQNLMFVADKDNKRVVALDLTGNLVLEISSKDFECLKAPSGVFVRYDDYLVSDNGTKDPSDDVYEYTHIIYIADASAVIGKESQHDKNLSI